MTAAARRRFDLMLAVVEHDATGMPEAETALEGARAVLRKHPDIPRGAARLDAAEQLMAARRRVVEEFGDAITDWAEVTAAATAAMAEWQRLSAVLADLFTIERDPDTGVYRKRYGA